MICPIRNKENYENYHLVPKEPPDISFKEFRHIETHIVPMEINYIAIIAPYKIKSNSYVDKDLIYGNPPNVRNKIVTFKADVDICILEEEVDRMLSISYYRDLMGKCSRAHKKIYNIFNNVTNNSLIPLYAGQEDPIHIRDPCRRWDEDESPVDILDSWKKNPSNIKEHVNALERTTKILNSNLLGKIVIVHLPQIKIYGNCFQGILQARLAGKYLDKLTDNELNDKIREIDFST